MSTARHFQRKSLLAGYHFYGHSFIYLFFLSGSKLLKSLVHDLSDFVEKIYRRLDTRTEGAGNYEVVAKVFLGFDHFDVRSTLETSVGGPSKAMIEAIVARRPKLTIEEFARVVEEKARRKDVADLLRAYDRGLLEESV